MTDPLTTEALEQQVLDDQAQAQADAEARALAEAEAEAKATAIARESDRFCGHCGSSRITGAGAGYYECFGCGWTFSVEDLR